jgi:hypothetical protein
VESQFIDSSKMYASTIIKKLVMEKYLVAVGSRIPTRGGGGVNRRF